MSGWLATIGGRSPTPRASGLCVDPEDRFVVNVWGVGYRMLD